MLRVMRATCHRVAAQIAALLLEQRDQHVERLEKSCIATAGGGRLTTVAAVALHRVMPWPRDHRREAAAPAWRHVVPPW